MHKLRFLTGKWVRPRESPVWMLRCSCCRGCGHNRNSLFFVWMSECGSGQKCDSRFSSRSEHDVFDLVGRPRPAEFKQLAIKHRPARKGPPRVSTTTKKVDSRVVHSKFSLKNSKCSHKLLFSCIPQMDQAHVINLLGKNAFCCPFTQGEPP